MPETEPVFAVYYMIFAKTTVTPGFYVVTAQDEQTALKRFKKKMPKIIARYPGAIMINHVLPFDGKELDDYSGPMEII